MSNDETANLKSHLKNLSANLAQTSNVDEELHSLLQQLDGDIRSLLERRTEAAAMAARDVADAESFGLAERTQELTARFAAEHPRLEPALRELGRMLANMGI
ncbi:MAG: DUF4404 family protein [Massilia sp.]